MILTSPQSLLAAMLSLGLSFAALPVLTASDDFEHRLAEIEQLYQSADFFAGWREAREMQREFRAHPDSARLADLLRNLTQARREAPEIRFAIDNLVSEDPIEVDISRQQILQGGETARILLRQAVQEGEPEITMAAADLLHDFDDAQRWEPLLSRLKDSPEASLRAHLEDHLIEFLLSHPEPAFAPTLEFLEDPEVVYGAQLLDRLVLTGRDDPETWENYLPRLDALLDRFARMAEDRRERQGIFAAALHRENQEILHTLWQTMEDQEGITLENNLPPGWRSADVGDVGETGQAQFTDNRLVIQGSGDDIWGSEDAFHFVYYPIEKDTSLTTRIHAQENTDTYAKSGLMIRQSLAEDSAHAMVVISPEGRRVAFQYRTEQGENMSSDSTGSYEFPIWLRLTREGNLIRSEESVDGEEWELVGESEISLEEKIYIGLVVCSSDRRVLNETVFELPLENLLAP